MDSVARIKERLDLVDFLRQYLTLTPAGRSMKALCPFHKEKTPSFMVSPERQAWHCFGCNMGGDLFEFVMKYENLEFFEALKVLAEKAGVDLKRFGGESEKQFAILFEVNRIAKDFFVAQLGGATAVAEAVRTYLFHDRGLTPETVSEFEIGFAPNSSDALGRHLTKLGYRMADIERAGLTFRTERGTYWDRFRGRIMFPLMNHVGKVVAFTGRILPGNEAEGVGKYVNSPETPLFRKSKLLFGFHQAKQFIRDAGSALLTEGQMDFLMMWQDGIRNVVATSGTALTPDHLKSLRRLADTLIVGFDSDAAGELAAERAIDLAGTADFSVKVLPPFPDPDMKDPADAVRRRPGLMKELVAKARPAMAYYFDRYVPERSASGFADPREFKRSVRTVLGKIKAVYSPIERAAWLRELSARARISEAALADELAMLKVEAVHRNDRETAPLPPSDPGPQSRYERIAEQLLILATSSEDVRVPLLEAARYFPSPYREALTARGERSVLPESVRTLLDRVEMSPSFAGRTVGSNVEECVELLRELKREYYRGERARLGERIRLCETEHDAAGLAAALADFDRITKELNTV